MPLANEDTLPVRQEPEGQRRFEDQPATFHKRVQEGYLKLVQADPCRWLVLDARLPQEEIADQVWQAVQDLSQRPALTGG